MVHTIVCTGAHVFNQGVHTLRGECSYSVTIYVKVLLPPFLSNYMSTICTVKSRSITYENHSTVHILARIRSL